MKIINNLNKQISNESCIIMDSLKCTSAAIFYENNIPYIDWKGTTILSDGRIVEAHIPKMSLDIQQIENNEERLLNFPYSSILKSRQVFVKDGFKPNEDIIITIKEREMTKEQIEKELGYKIKIKE